MKKLLFAGLAASLTVAFALGADIDPLGASAENVKAAAPKSKVKRLGGLTPLAALDYMKTTPNLVIVEVNTNYWKLKTGFIGAMHIPHDEMEKRYNEIPQGRPVILHCGAGAVAPSAYETLAQKRHDIPELSYIAGSPLILEYNEWYRSTHSK